MSQQDNNQMQQHFYRASAADFGKIPGSPVAYWISEKILALFNGHSLEKNYFSEGPCKTGNDDVYLRVHWEVDSNAIGFNNRWCFCSKGGDYRKYYGNIEHVIKWDSSSKEHYRKDKISRLTAEHVWNREGVTWSIISSKSEFSFRLLPSDAQFNSVSPTIFKKDIGKYSELGILMLLNSTVVSSILSVLNPTLALNVGNVLELPIVDVLESSLNKEKVLSISISDWDANESSWGFANLPLLIQRNARRSTSAYYQALRAYWHETTLEMQRLEQENNRLFIEAYGLQDELTPEVPLSEITLTCNPHYRYGNNLTDEEREARLQSDTLAELISYAIGCMMGRYSLDREGLVYAHAGNEGFKALVEEGAYDTFAADEDGILPLSTDSWFEDDVATRLEAFVCTVWGKETLEENLQFIADSLCLAAIKPVKKGGETSRETIRRYLSTQLYKDHLKTYKKRPIYWLFSSGKEKAFECLVYLHRYNEATLPRMRTEYVTPLLGQMAGRIERLRLQQTEASTSDAKRIGKEIDSLTKQLAELRAFDDQLKHHADMRITLDLDDGVKVNYGKFGTLLSDVKAITGDKGE
ncbi:BREX-1 system adenine-specific DNA-methyltransferase PglX [Aeromonas taiwanensis]|uniref:BREX-1 system adenine-specific DNA-methyltransferase PglX n=1 Tax=Aeromonas caviae TaxID=648 RepID=UPI001F267E93|nr:BREX-1 system adenine-specific DNA-methyltransferase PglX [Aeromonas caviae]UJQ36019.1 BREX-1 system adenine-specific DNA-methyltransferase PglX [Aeromonas caviae]